MVRENTPLAKKGLLGLGMRITGAWLIGGILFIESGAVFGGEFWASSSRDSTRVR